MSSRCKEACLGTPPLEEESAGAPETSGGAPARALIPGDLSQLTPKQQALVVSAIRVVRSIVKRRMPRASRALLSELEAAALADVMAAAKNFDPDRGVRFSSYVVPYIHGAIADYFAQEGRQAAIARAGVLAARELMAQRSHRADWGAIEGQTPEMSEEALLDLTSELATTMVVSDVYEPADAEEDMLDRLCRRRANEAIRGALEQMTKKQRRLMTLWFVEQRKQREVAEELKEDPRSVRRHAKEVLEILREALAVAGITEMPGGRG